MSKPNKNSKKMLDWFLNIFGCKELRYLPECVLKEILAGNTDIFEEYLKEYPDLEKDSLREFFETYLADRKFLNQDFTPDDLALLMTEICLADRTDKQPEVLDEAAGIGCLLIPFWRHNPDVVVYARELSLTTIPFLLFNLALRNMQGIVIRGDTLTLDTFQVYLLTKGEKFSKVEEIDYLERVKETDPIFIIKAMMAYQPQRYGIVRPQ